MGVLRLALALLVLVGHACTKFGIYNPALSGLVAVEIFFAISGFYMALVLEAKYVDRTREFYWNRALRIFPTYWIVLFLSVIAGVIFTDLNKFHSIYDADIGYGAKLILYLSNILLLGSDLTNYLTVNGSGHLVFTSHFLTENILLSDYLYIPQAWSLPVELAFYVAAPFFIRDWKRIVAVIISAFIIKSVTLMAFDFTDPWKYRFTLGEFGVFALGALAYKLIPFLKRRVRMEAFGWPMLISILLLSGVYRWMPNLGFLVAIGYIFYVILCLPFIFETFKNNSVDRHIGELSYPVYVGHMLIIGVVASLNFPMPLVWSIIGSILLAIILYGLADRIERRFRREQSRPTPTPALIEAEGAI